MTSPREPRRLARLGAAFFLTSLAALADTQVAITPAASAAGPAVVVTAAAPPRPAPVAPADWGAPPAVSSRTADGWAIDGLRQHVWIDPGTLCLNVTSGPNRWIMEPATVPGLVIRSQGREYTLALAEAKTKEFMPYATGFKTGFRIVLSGWTLPDGSRSDVTLRLTVALEGGAEDLVFDVVADPGRDVVRQLDWPTALEANDVDYTVLSNARGMLLPRAWPQEYSPMRRNGKDGKVDPTDHSLLQSHVIESWSMSWWGFLRGEAGMMIIVETPDDASYRFSHPAGGPTVIGPRWLPSLGRLGYERTARMVFLDSGGYVAMAKRYRQYAMDSGLFVSLKEKIARTPAVADLIGTPHSRVSILKNLSTDSDRYDTANPSENYSLTTFDQRAAQLRDLKAKGVDKTIVYVSAWQHEGYDHQHPDPLPPPEAAGGWPGLERLFATCRELGYPMIFHDQYRDYYASAGSFDTDFAVHEEDDSTPAQAFAGSRFGDWKEGQVPYMRHWDGGKQAYLNARFQLGHLEKNYRLFFDHGIHPEGIYIDVIGYVPPDEDFNPNHPTTRTEAMAGEESLLNWSHAHIGFTITEAGSDWVVPYADVVNQSGGTAKGIPIPLYNLVYHDAVFITYGNSGSVGDKGLLQGLLVGGVPELPVGRRELSAAEMALVQEMEKLNRRVALVEMTDHRFLNAERTQEQTQFADGTTVTVDWTRKTATVSPDLP